MGDATFVLKDSLMLFGAGAVGSVLVGSQMYGLPMGSSVLWVGPAAATLVQPYVMNLAADAMAKSKSDPNTIVKEYMGLMLAGMGVASAGIANLMGVPMREAVVLGASTAGAQGAWIYYNATN
jgi:hypothetical protein